MDLLVVPRITFHTDAGPSETSVEKVGVTDEHRFIGGDVEIVALPLQVPEVVLVQHVVLTVLTEHCGRSISAAEIAVILECCDVASTGLARIRAWVVNKRGALRRSSFEVHPLRGESPIGFGVKGGWMGTRKQQGDGMYQEEGKCQCHDDCQLHSVPRPCYRFSHVAVSGVVRLCCALLVVTAPWLSAEFDTDVQVSSVRY